MEVNLQMFLLSLYRKESIKEDDIVITIRSQIHKFSIKTLFTTLDRTYNYVSSKCDKEPLGAVKSEHFYLGGYLSKRF